MPKSQPLPVDTNQKPISGYSYGVYFLPCNGRTIQGLCSVSFADERELLAKYDDIYPGRGPGLVRVYSDGTRFELRPKG